MGLKLGVYLLSFALLAFVMLLAATPQSASPSLYKLSGATVQPDDWRGRIVVLSFSATWVPLAGKALPSLQQLADRHRARGVDVYWVSVNSLKTGDRVYASDDELSSFVAKHNAQITVLRDPQKTVWRHYKLEALPSTVILDRNGKLWSTHIGFDTEQANGFATVEGSLLDLLREEAVAAK